MAECPSRFTLVQYKSGDLSEVETRALDEHVVGCAACQAKMRQIEANLAQYGPKQEAFSAQLISRLSTEKPSFTLFPKRVFWALSFAGAAVTVVAMLISIYPGKEQTVQQQQTKVRFKGRVVMRAVAQRGTDQFVVEPNAKLFPGDALRFIVTTSSEGYLSIFSIDSRHVIAPFYPDSDPISDPKPMVVKSAGRHELPGSIVLDDAIGAECIVTAFSRKPFDRGAVHERVRRSLWFSQSRVPGPGETKPDVGLSVLWINKSL
ncbi:MAG: DUF4384 domain-containing protein [Deltaproteobacteria bacterium]|nr:DUF4384 domain-containing protein [Deltaproteobacteria bacterium]